MESTYPKGGPQGHDMAVHRDAPVTYSGGRKGIGQHQAKEVAVHHERHLCMHKRNAGIEGTGGNAQAGRQADSW